MSTRTFFISQTFVKVLKTSYLCSVKHINSVQMKNYIAYYRVSTSKQSLGLDAQKTSVINYLNSVDDSCIMAEYSETESGRNDTRVELANAINHCKRIGATLIIAKLDRLSRNVSFVFQLKDSGIDFVACDLP